MGGAGQGSGRYDLYHPEQQVHRDNLVNWDHDYTNQKVNCYHDIFLVKSQTWPTSQNGSVPGCWLTRTTPGATQGCKPDESYHATHDENTESSVDLTVGAEKGGWYLG